MDMLPRLSRNVLRCYVLSNYANAQLNNGEVVKMSKRTGKALRDLIDEVGADASLLLKYSADDHADFILQ